MLSSISHTDALNRISEPLSTFQALGLIYHIADAFVRFDISLADKAAEFVSRQLSQDGWPEQVVDCFLAAPDWPSRMLTAFCLVGDEGRKKAVQLDYEAYINYWPSDAFMEPEWMSKAKLLTGAPANNKLI